MGKNFCKIENKWCKFLRKGICGVSKNELEHIGKCPRIAEIETTTLYTLVREVDFEDVFSIICHYYEDEIKNRVGYEEAFKELKLKRQKKHNLNDLFIEVEIGKENEIEYLDVYGVKTNSDIRFGLEFCKWDYWVTMFITKDTLTNLSKEQIVAGCLYEMTFFGFSEEKIKEFHDEMEKDIEEAKSNNK